MACNITTSIYLPDELVASLRERTTAVLDQGNAIRGIMNDMNALVGLTKRGKLRVQISSVVASQTVTCDESAAVNDTDTLTVGGTALAVKASPANESQVSKGSTDAEFAANVAAKINAHSVISKFCYAVVTTSASGIVTVYSLFPGPIGNFITLAEAGDGFTLGGATLSGGTSDAVYEYNRGYDTESELDG